MNAREVFDKQDGGLTQSFYAALNARGPRGEIAVALFRAQKRSSRAKDYGRGKYRRAAYDVKAWSMNELCRLLRDHGERLGFRWGWKEDPEVRFGEEASWCLYVEIPAFGQCSFHSPARGHGPAYAGEWDGQHASAERIVAFADYAYNAIPLGYPAPDLETVYQSANAGNQYAPISPPLKFGDPDSIARARKRR